MDVQAEHGAEDQPFGQWLLDQTKRGDWISDLAKGMRALPNFTKSGTPDDLRALLHLSGATGDDFEALDDAELAWLRS